MKEGREEDVSVHSSYGNRVKGVNTGWDKLDF